MKLKAMLLRLCSFLGAGGVGIAGGGGGGGVGWWGQNITRIANLG